MAKCQVCGWETENEKFCKNCGSKVKTQKTDSSIADNELEKKFCANCGTEMSEKDDFCSECGTPAGSVAPNHDANINTGRSYLIHIIVGYILTVLVLLGGGIIVVIITIILAIYLIKRPETGNDNFESSVGALINHPSKTISSLVNNPDGNLYLHAVLLIVLSILFLIIHAIIAALTTPSYEYYYVFWYY